MKNLEEIIIGRIWFQANIQIPYQVLSPIKYQIEDQFNIQLKSQIQNLICDRIWNRVWGFSK